MREESPPYRPFDAARRRPAHTDPGATRAVDPSPVLFLSQTDSQTDSGGSRPIASIPITWLGFLSKTAGSVIGIARDHVSAWCME